MAILPSVSCAGRNGFSSAGWMRKPAHCCGVGRNTLSVAACAVPVSGTASGRTRCQTCLPRQQPDQQQHDDAQQSELLPARQPPAGRVLPGRAGLSSLPYGVRCGRSAQAHPRIKLLNQDPSGFVGSRPVAATAKTRLCDAEPGAKLVSAFAYVYLTALRARADLDDMTKEGSASLMRLLLVEDNTRLLTLTRDALGRAGFDTDGVSDSQRTPRRHCAPSPIPPWCSTWACPTRTASSC